MDSLGATTERPPAGAPTLRSTIERLFRTFGLKLMPLLAGRTYGNPKERRDYDSKHWASLSDDELIQVLILFVVDVYHNQPHEGLFGETPANCWVRLSKEYGVTPPPDGHVRRAVFGTRQTRELRGNGVRMFGIDYTCQALRAHFIHGHDRTLELRVDERDLGWISVKVGKKMVSGHCVATRV
ncbi:MAG: Mu transposase C-terminal domain-containing protein [Paracoccaceae bacterium]